MDDPDIATSHPPHPQMSLLPYDVKALTEMLYGAVLGPRGL